MTDRERRYCDEDIKNHYSGLEWTCAKYCPSWLDKEEFFQSCITRIVLKYHTFDNTKGTFKNWAWKIISTMPHMLARNNRVAKNKDGYLVRDCSIDEFDHYEVPATDDGWQDGELANYLTQIPVLHAQVFLAVYLNKMPITNVSIITGLSPKTCKDICNDARECLVTLLTANSV